MKVKSGYKQTEIGILPDEWDLKPIGEIAKVVGGGTPPTSIQGYWNGGIDWYVPTEIGYCKYSTGSQRKITAGGLKNSSAKMLPEGTVLLTSRASIGDLMILTSQATTNQGFQSLIPKEDLNNEYLYYQMAIRRNELMKNSSGSTFLEISPSKVKSIEIPLPPTIEEQKAITKALSDVDSLLENLEKLINKKRNLKQAAMQELLTGKTRLPGFEDKWELHHLGKYLTF